MGISQYCIQLSHDTLSTINIFIYWYTGPLSDDSTRDNTYSKYPGSPSQYLFALPRTSNSGQNDEYFLYAVNAQGGGIIKSPNDSVIEGVYTEYIVPGPFSVGFRYTHFDLSECE